MTLRRRWGFATVHEAVEHVKSWVAEDVCSARDIDRLAAHFVVKHHIVENGYCVVSLAGDDITGDIYLALTIQYLEQLRPEAAVAVEVLLEAEGDVRGISVTVQYPDLSIVEYLSDAVMQADEALFFKQFRTACIDDEEDFPLTINGWRYATEHGIWSASLGEEEEVPDEVSRLN